MRSAVLLTLLCCAGLTASIVLAQQMYRYVDQDGRVVYTDRPPPPNAKRVEQKNLRGNVIETNDLPPETVAAQRRSPVTLFVFDCGELCDRAKGLLNRRGVPHALLDSTDAQGADKLRQLTGSLEVPVLQVGDRVIRGFEESQWQAALDQAGYPKTPPVRAALTGRAQQLPPPAGTRQTPATLAPDSSARVDGEPPKKP